MLLFLDTEFTDFETKGLLSFGLVRADGRDRLYVERTDQPKERCSTFVQNVVVPLMGDPAAKKGDETQARAMVLDWLDEQVGPYGERPHETLVIACDYQADARLLRQQIGREGLDERGLPIPRFLDCSGLLDHGALTRAFQGPPGSPRLRRHHALDDAEALRCAHLAWVGAETTPLDEPLARWAPDLVRKAPWFALSDSAFTREERWERWRA